MKAVIMAAGEGKRMRPLTNIRPKVMLPVAGRPILEHVIENAKGAGVTEFLIIVNYRAGTIREHFGDGSGLGVKISYAFQEKPLGTAHALGTVAPLIKGDFLLMSGDSIFDVGDIKKIVSVKGNAMALIEVENPEDYGTVVLEGTKVAAIHEKSQSPPSNLANAGLYHFTTKIFDAVKKTQKSKRGEYELTDSIMLVREDGTPTEGIPVSGWLDLGRPWDLLEANAELLKGLRPEEGGDVQAECSFEIDDGVTLKGAVKIGAGTRVMAGSYIEGPVIIGENCKIGPNCYIRSTTVVGDGCHIGNACEIKNSIIMSNSNVPHQNYVGDSVIGENVNLGAGTKIANLSLDDREITVGYNGEVVNTGRRKLGAIIGDNVKSGINAVIAPGTFIGAESFIGMGAKVFGELAQKSRVK